jgi:hypothetical protein
MNNETSRHSDALMPPSDAAAKREAVRNRRMARRARHNIKETGNGRTAPVGAQSLIRSSAGWCQRRGNI